MSGFIVRHGQPTPEELGIVVAVLSSAVASRVDPMATTHRPLRNWAAPMQFHRPTAVRPGRGVWVLAGRTR